MPTKHILGTPWQKLWYTWRSHRFRGGKHASSARTLPHRSSRANSRRCGPQRNTFWSSVIALTPPDRGAPSYLKINPSTGPITLLPFPPPGINGCAQPRFPRPQSKSSLLITRGKRSSRKCSVGGRKIDR